MFEETQLITFVIACCVVAVLPGPTMTVILASSLRYGTGAGLLNVAGTQAGLATMIIITATGLELIIYQMSFIFDWFRMIGAAYLIWLGIKLYSAPGPSLTAAVASDGQRSFFLQGFLVIWSNPKVLLFLSAFLPQFVDVKGQVIIQALILGGIFMTVEIFFDSIYAFLARESWKLVGQKSNSHRRVNKRFLFDSLRDLATLRSTTSVIGSP